MAYIIHHFLHAAIIQIKNKYIRRVLTIHLDLKAYFLSSKCIAKKKFKKKKACVYFGHMYFYRFLHKHFLWENNYDIFNVLVLQYLNEFFMTKRVQRFVIWMKNLKKGWKSLFLIVEPCGEKKISGNRSHFFWTRKSSLWTELPVYVTWSFLNFSHW